MKTGITLARITLIASMAGCINEWFVVIPPLLVIVGISAPIIDGLMKHPLRSGLI